MPKYYCDYCDKYLTHDSPSVRKSHTVGKQHKLAVQLFYQQFEAEFTQSLIEARLKEYEESKGRLIHQPPMGIIPTPYGGQMYQPPHQQQQQGLLPFQGMPPHQQGMPSHQQGMPHQQGMVLPPGMPIHKMPPHQFNNNSPHQHGFQPPHHQQHHPHQQHHQQQQHHNQPTIPGL
ncbi:hypothetical protein ACTFIV_005453 [Dictyostelium citrinum]